MSANPKTALQGLGKTRQGPDPPIFLDRHPSEYNRAYNIMVVEGVRGNVLELQRLGRANDSYQDLYMYHSLVPGDSTNQVTADTTCNS